MHQSYVNETGKIYKWLQPQPMKESTEIQEDIKSFKIWLNIKITQITLSTKRFLHYKSKDHRHQESVYESQQNIQMKLWTSQHKLLKSHN